MTEITDLNDRAACVAFLCSFPGGESLIEVQTAAVQAATRKGWIKEGGGQNRGRWYATPAGHAAANRLRGKRLNPPVTGWAWGEVPPS